MEEQDNDEDIVSEFVKGKSKSATPDDSKTAHIGGPLHKKESSIDDEYYKINRLGISSLFD